MSHTYKWTVNPFFLKKTEDKGLCMKCVHGLIWISIELDFHSKCETSFYLALVRYVPM